MIYGIEGCQNIRLSTLSRIKGLKKLELLGRKKIPSFEFLGNCKTLNHLVVTANPLSKTDISALTKNKTLKKVFLGVKDSLIKKIGEINRNAVITNGKTCYSHGKKCHPYSAYYD